MKIIFVQTKAGNHTETSYILNVILALKLFFFVTNLSPVHYQPSRDSKLLQFSLSLPLWATLGKHCLVSVQRDCNLENKRQKLRWDGF